MFQNFLLFFSSRETAPTVHICFLDVPFPHLIYTQSTDMTFTDMKISKYLQTHWINFRRLFCDTSHNYAVDTSGYSDIKRCAKVTQGSSSIRVPKPVHEPPQCQGCDSAPAQMSPCPWQYLCKIKLCYWNLFWIQKEGNPVLIMQTLYITLHRPPTLTRCTQQNRPCSTQSTFRALHTVFESHLNKTGNRTESIHTYVRDHFQLAFQLLNYPVAN